MRIATTLLVLVLGATPAFAARTANVTPRTAELPAGKADPKLDAPKLDPGSLDFDLLAPAPATPALTAAQLETDALLQKRRTLLTLHQTLGIGLVASMAGTMVTGQLNYNDRYGEAQSGRYALSHRVLSYTTLAAFTANGLLALFAPVPTDRKLSFDRVMVHRIALGLATLGMATQAVLGIVTAGSDGLVRQQQLATAHLAVGYATLGFMTIGVGSIVF